MNLTQDHLIEVFNRLRKVAYWMYYDPEGIEAFSNGSREVDGKTFTFNVGKDGYYYTTEQESKKIGKFEVIFRTGPPEYGIANIKTEYNLVNKDELDEEFIKIFEKVGIFNSSAFQRMIAFTFISYMQPNTAQGIIGDLLTLNTNENL